MINWIKSIFRKKEQQQFLQVNGSSIYSNLEFRWSEPFYFVPFDSTAPSKLFKRNLSSSTDTFLIQVDGGEFKPISINDFFRYGEEHDCEKRAYLELKTSR